MLHGRRDSSFLCNRRVFAAADCGIPDGIKVDEAGNVYTGTGEGVAIYSPGVQALPWQPKAYLMLRHLGCPVTYILCPAFITYREWTAPSGKVLRL